MNVKEKTEVVQATIEPDYPLARKPDQPPSLSLLGGKFRQTRANFWMRHNRTKTHTGSCNCGAFLWLALYGVAWATMIYLWGW